MTSSTTTTKIRTVKEIEELNKRKPPPGRRPVLPRVYESWGDENGEELEEEYERIRLPGSASSDDDLGRRVPKKTRKQRALECQARYDEWWQREEEERLRQAEAQRLEDLRFPSKLGWFYTNGYYDMYPPFGIKKELLQTYTDMGIQFEENRRKREPETFAEKFKRNFWPPKLLFNGKYFRTRGCYLDFPEVLANPIENIDVNFEKKSSILPNTDPTLKEDDVYDPYGEKDEVVVGGGGDDDGVAVTTGEDGIPSDKLQLDGSSGPLVSGDFNVGWDSYYYDDEKGEFFLKTPGHDIMYYFDGFNSCWRRKRGKMKPVDQSTPYDFYYDNGEFFPREQYWGKHTLDISFDEKLGIWKYDPKVSTRIKIKAGIFESNEKKNAGKTKNKQTNKNETNKKLNGKDSNVAPAEDFFFDEMDSVWMKKVEAPSEIRIENDDNGRRWIRRYEGDWRGLTGYSPDDYVWIEDMGKFQLRPSKLAENYFYSTTDGVWRPKKVPKFLNKGGLTCTDYFFEDGMFKKKEPHSENLYRRMRYALIFVKKDLPISGLYPEDFYFDHSKKIWLPRSIRMTVLKSKEEELPWGKAYPGKEVVILTKDDWYFDIEEGIFIKKTPEGIKNKMYYYDQQDGVWKSSDLREKHRLHIFPHDFYFNGKNFSYKNRKASLDTYVYHELKGVYRSKEGMERGDPSEFFYDYEREMWKTKKEDTKAKFDSSGHFVKPFPERRSPDSYYFDESEGRFIEKAAFTPENQFYFAANEGAYKMKGKKGPSLNGLTSRDFYWDDYDSRWKLKILGQDKDYWWDKNNRFFRHIISMSSRSGLSSTDYYFSPNIGSWFLVMNYDANRGKIRDDKLNWDPIRNYDKPWLKSAPARYGKNPGTKVIPSDAWEGKERIPFDRPARESTLGRFGTDDQDDPPQNQLKMTGVDIYTTNPTDIQRLFPKAVEVVINNDEEAAYITFRTENDLKDAVSGSQNRTYNGKPMKVKRLSLSESK